MRDPAARRRLTPRRLVGILVATFAGLALLGGIGAWRVFARAHATIAEHRARIPAETAALGKRARGRPALLEPRRDGDGAAVVAAFLAAVEVVPRSDLQKLSPESDAAPVPEEMDAVLAAHPEPLAALEGLANVPVAPRPPSDSDVLTHEIPRWGTGARWLFAATRRARERGDVALSRRLALLEATLGCDLERDGSILTLLVGGGIARVGAYDLVRAMGAGAVEAEEARRLKEAFLELDRSSLSADDVYAVERRDVRALLSAPASGVFSPFERPGVRSLWSWDVERANALAEWDEDLDRVAAEARAWRGALPALNARTPAVAAVRSDTLARTIALHASIPRLLARTLAVLRVARVALAVAEFRARTGEVPASLSALVPAYLPAVPLDPWDGAPLRYDAGKVWSIGDDQKDDGGTPPPDPDDIDRPGDFVAPAPSPPPKK